MTVVVSDIRLQDRLEMAAAEDEGAVEALTAQRSREPFRERVSKRCPDRRTDDLGALGGKYLVEAARVFGVPIPDEEAERDFFSADDQVARLLGDPGGIGIGGHIREVHLRVATSTREHIETTKKGRVDSYEVAGDDAFSLGPQELLPRRSRPLGAGVDALVPKDRPHRARCDWIPRCLSSPWMRR
jgi:hypothetical protein